MLTSFEDIYHESTRARRDKDNLEALLLEALQRANADIEHIMFHKINWSELMEALHA